jgi:hypothetical protein
MLDDLGRGLPDELRESWLKPPSADPQGRAGKRVAQYERVERLLHGACAVSAPPAASGTHRIELVCSVHGGSSLIVCQQDRDTLRLVSNELVAGAGALTAVSPAAALGSFRIEVAATWPGCALCRARYSPVHHIGPFWWCECHACQGRILHCAGSDREGRFRAACGRFVKGPFALGTFVVTHGWSSATRGEEPPQQGDQT